MSWRMSRADWVRWSSARGLAELGELTALWLEGNVRSQPGYQAGCGPDPETEALIPVLARANRAGYLTDGSQPGCAEELDDEGKVWTQRAVVQGWIAQDRARGLVGAARAAGLVVITHPVLRRRFARRSREFVDVTRCDGMLVTGFGGQPRAADVRFQYAECCSSALAEIVGSLQVTLAAPEYGPNQTVWTVVDEWAAA